MVKLEKLGNKYFNKSNNAELIKKVGNELHVNETNVKNALGINPSLYDLNVYHTTVTTIGVWIDGVSPVKRLVVDMNGFAVEVGVNPSTIPNLSGLDIKHIINCYSIKPHYEQFNCVFEGLAWKWYTNYNNAENPMVEDYVVEFVEEISQ